VVGYVEVAQRLLADPRTKLEGNPYRAWIEAYSSDEYRAVAATAIGNLDRQAAARGGEARYASLLATFTAATRLEEAFWGMGWRKR
jgi:thiaminase/transcriptional activator TenA